MRLARRKNLAIRTKFWDPLLLGIRCICVKDVHVAPTVTKQTMDPLAFSCQHTSLASFPYQHKYIHIPCLHSAKKCSPLVTTSACFYCQTKPLFLAWTPPSASGIKHHLLLQALNTTFRIRLLFHPVFASLKSQGLPYSIRYATASSGHQVQYNWTPLKDPVNIEDLCIKETTKRQDNLRDLNKGHCWGVPL